MDLNEDISHQPIPPPPPARIWFAILGAPLAWMAASSIGWFLEGRSCVNPDRGFWFMGPVGVRALELVIMGAGLLVTFAAIAIGASALYGSRDRAGWSIQGKRRAEFLAGVALLMGSVFTVAMVYAGLPPIMLGMCEKFR